MTVLSASFVRSQCTVDAGRDTVLCGGIQAQYDTITLGGDPLVTGGVPPFTYAWSASLDLGMGFQYTASDMLDDTTAAHPSLVNPMENLWYTLEVSDANGATCVDSVHVGLSQFYISLGYVNVYLAQGDSFQFFAGQNLSSNYPPCSYVWHPSADLSDSTALTAWASPSVYTQYWLSATDSAGCYAEGAPLYYVLVTPTQVPNSAGQGEGLVVLSDGASIEVRLAGAERTPFEVRLFDASGQLCGGGRMFNGVWRKDLSGHAPGAYSVLVEGPAIRTRTRFVLQ